MRQCDSDKLRSRLTHELNLLYSFNFNFPALTFPSECENPTSAGIKYLTLFFPTTETADISAPGRASLSIVICFFLENIAVPRYFKLGLLWSDNFSRAPYRGGADPRGWFNATFRQISRRPVTCDCTSVFRNTRNQVIQWRVTKIRSLSSKKPRVHRVRWRKGKNCLHIQKRKKN